ncbi:hypothetical protein [Cellulosimicrobium sp. CUA-896]|uniref:hypothetical protein n=1 Tax=Cellulosimicrobium sp. CUA-896 TaxID=1517881 RepID=UPI002101CACC|nr:hypothetical protein [Cellulosimicrobium sp. CUA-896]
MTATIQTTTDDYPTRLTTPGAMIPREHPTVWGGPDDGPFDAAALEAHAERGFTILEDFITPDEVTAYTAELDRLASDPDLRGDVRVITEKRRARCAPCST